ncbi:MAG: hypothetical protein ACTHKA_26310 [Anaerocolumna jejuensis]
MVNAYCRFTPSAGSSTADSQAAWYNAVSADRIIGSALPLILSDY